MRIQLRLPFTSTPSGVKTATSCSTTAPRNRIGAARMISAGRRRERTIIAPVPRNAASPWVTNALYGLPSTPASTDEADSTITSPNPVRKRVSAQSASAFGLPSRSSVGSAMRTVSGLRLVRNVTTGRTAWSVSGVGATTSIDPP